MRQFFSLALLLARLLVCWAFVFAARHVKDQGRSATSPCLQEEQVQKGEAFVFSLSSSLVLTHTFFFFEQTKTTTMAMAMAMVVVHSVGYR